jgi:ubiquinone/menaquinone biosynthesis C-methylase UbiE
VKDVDVAFFHRVLHMIEHRQAYLNATAKYLKPDGRIVVIDKNREDSPDSWMWLQQSDVDTWMAAISFYPAEHFSVFDDRYFVSYQRPYGNSVLLKKREEKRD